MSELDDEIYVCTDFQGKEVKCKCGCGFYILDYGLINRVQCLRTIMDIPFDVSSWCRCELHNRREGGTKDSMHPEGKAIDIIWRNWPTSLRYMVLQNAFLMDFSGIGISKNYFHLDISDVKRRVWLY